MFDYDFSRLKSQSEELNRISDKLSQSVVAVNHALRSMNLGIPVGMDTCEFPLSYEVTEPEMDPEFEDEGERVVIARFQIEPTDSLEDLLLREAKQRERLGARCREDYERRKSFSENFGEPFDPADIDPFDWEATVQYLAYEKYKGEWQLVCQSGKGEQVRMTNAGTIEKPDIRFVLLYDLHLRPTVTPVTACSRQTRLAALKVLPALLKTLEGRAGDLVRDWSQALAENSPPGPKTSKKKPKT